MKTAAVETRLEERHHLKQNIDYTVPHTVKANDKTEVDFNQMTYNCFFKANDMTKYSI